eukprot:CAMPEP_0115154952 /NCGR_PEP_ID=MMETSP0227-20121206/67602_1 /TAXON_ID=89957 /ORGANISM="Polarella glacialis, Strain CCMP 1383" /LENGTH=181 /DNA_ID=CAMNT_0002565929 /DNA_START=217 /DNA_END=759 /DNA_ORIENTATION=-
MPPVEVWDGIQSVRQTNDKAREMEIALEGIQPFNLSLAHLSYFEHGKRSCTVWLDPAVDKEAGASLAALQSDLVGAFPDCTDLSSDEARGITRFVPHLSLGGWRGVKDAEQAIDTLKRSWRPVEFEVGSVCLLSRKSFDDPFQLRWEVPLGRDRRQQLATSKLRNLKYAAAPPQRADAELE